MTEKSHRRRDARSCLNTGQPGNRVRGPLESGPPQQPTGPTRPHGGYRSSRFRWRPDSSAQDGDD